MKVGVASHRPGEGGSYRVRVSRQAGGAAAAAPLLSVGVTFDGELDANDARGPEGRLQDIWLVPGGDEGPLELRIEARGDAVPLALLVDSHGRALSAAESGVYHLVEPGFHRLQLLSPEAEATAGYRLSLQRATAGATPVLSRGHHQLPPQPATVALAVGEARSGALGDGEGTLPTGEPADLYALEGRSGQTLRLELRSDAFDPYLILLAPSGRHFENDDSGGTTHSALELELPEDGTYRVVASAYRAGMTGPYELKVSEGARPSAAPQALVAAAGPGGDALVRTGSLAAGDATLSSGELADRYTFAWEPGQRWDLRLTSEAFDPYLIVRSPSGEQRDNDDVSDTDRNAGLLFEVTEAGAHEVLVTSYQAGENGAYELTLTEQAGGGDTPTPAPAVAAAGGGDTLHGELATGDAQLQSGELVDTHELTLALGEHVHLEVRSAAFDTYVIVKPPSGDQQENDDAPGGGTNAALDLVAGSAGTYQVLVTSYRPGEAGPYELLVRRGDSGAAPSPAGETEAPSVAAQGDVQNGALAAGDATLPTGELADRYTRTFEAGAPVRIRLTSSAIDPYLIVTTPSGRQIDNDDANATTRDSLVELPAAEAGTYRITATSYQPGETGAYALRFERGTAIPRADGGEGAGQGGRVFGLFAGITDYPPGVGDLPECANDAVKLAEALRDEGLLDASRQVLLTDAQATTTNVRSAMQRFAGEVGPDDVFVFFYSGHGGQRPGSRDAREIDGTDEFLVLHDGPLVDDELGQLFDGLRAQVAVVALDACFSGGFAKDLVTRPGRVGLFSSEEDVLSAVASQFQAGGYLSHFLRTAVSGEADRAPADRVLTVGELTHFLYTQFGRHAADVELQGAYQHLVVDRGAVHVDQVLWAYR